MNVPSAQYVSTFFLKAVLIVMGIGALAIVVFSFLPMWNGAIQGLPDYAYVIYSGFIGIYTTIIPFLFALFQAWKLLRLIDANNAFSEASVNALRTIKYSAVTMSALYWMAMPLVFVLADLDDAPGGVLMGAAFACAPLVVATFAAVLQKLVQSAITLKQENDLTI